MSDENTSGVPLSFWIVSAVGLIWNLMGAMNYLGQMNAEVLAAMPESHRAIVEGRPVWATSGFAIAVWGGSAGCLLLLLRKAVAYYVLIASLVGVVVATIPVLGIAGELELGGGEVVMMIVMPAVVGVALVWHAKRSIASGWVG